MNFLNMFSDPAFQERFFKHYMPIFILAGVGILFFTFLGPIGIVLVIAGIAFVIYMLERSLSGK